MRYVIIPADIPIMSPDGTTQLHEPIGVSGESRPLVMNMTKFLDVFVLNDVKCSKNLKAVRSAIALQDALRDAPGSTALVEEADWELAKSVLEEPSTPFSLPYILRQSMPFVDAILNATPAVTKK